MTNKRWQFWRRRSAKPDPPETIPEIDTETVSRDKQQRDKQQSDKQQSDKQQRDKQQSDKQQRDKQPRTRWRFGRLTASDTSATTDAVAPEDVAGNAPVGKHRWWQRSRAAVPEQTAPRPLNPDGTLPPDLLEQFTREHNTDRAMRNYLKRFLTKVEEAEQQGKIDEVVKDVDSKLSGMERGKLTDVWEKVQTLGKLMRDPAAHWQSKAVALASLVYVVSPLDAIPDVIPGLGLTDDVAVVVAVVSYLGSALNRYAQTELKEQLEDHSDREIKKHLLKNRISLLYAAAAAAFVLAMALLLQYFQG